MNNLMMSVGTYVLILLAVILTVGFAWFLVVGRAVAKKNKVFDKELDAMTQRIKKRKTLNGKATNHNIDLEQFNNGGWTGPIPQSNKAPPKPPHNPHK